jgi:hypothetical protein
VWPRQPNFRNLRLSYSLRFFVTSKQHNQLRVQFQTFRIFMSKLVIYHICIIMPIVSDLNFTGEAGGCLFHFGKYCCHISTSFFLFLDRLGSIFLIAVIFYHSRAIICSVVSVCTCSNTIFDFIIVPIIRHHADVTFSSLDRLSATSCIEKL